jgi:putative FmdB family regulatory protein
MPLYEYQCENCGDRFELIEKFSSEPLTTHEKCGGKVHRLISAPALQFKGSGWYVNDYAKSGSTNPGNGGHKKDGESSSGGKEAGSSSSSESGKDSSAGSSSSESSKGESSKGESSKGESSKSDSSKSASTPAPSTTSASSDKK